jgi:hypothetical protein
MKSPNFILSSLLILAINTIVAQKPYTPKPRFQKTLNGDVTLLANNSVNRVDYNNTSNIPYYNQSSASPLNDAFYMEYIDIDEDKTTFSSSSAELFLESENRKIVYAGLYWAGTYKYNSGIEKKENKFTAEDPTREAINTIKIKLPNQEQYTSLTGTVIFDGINDSSVKESAPYVVYADITEKITQLTNPNGVYTIANVRATQGTLFGGSAAGWTIFIVYEDAKKPQKHITTFDGFAELGTSTINTTVNGFKTVAQGEVKAKIAFAALDGDSGVSGDKLSVKTQTAKDFKLISNTVRKPDNFFNSAISIENKHQTNRFPDSKNTLGFDAGIISIPNINNTLLGNNVTDLQIKMESINDKVFWFFTSLIVDESSVTPQNNSVNNKATANIHDIYNIKKVQVIKEMYADVYQTTSAKNLSNKENTFKKGEIVKELIEIQDLKLASQEKGFYVVANAFTKPENVKPFVTLLKLKDVQTTTFVNKLNNYTFVYLKRFDTLAEAIEFYKSKADNTYTDRLYIVSVNNTITGLADLD